MVQILEISDEEYRKMYSGCKKETLIEMLVEKSRELDTKRKDFNIDDIKQCTSSVFTCPVCKGRGKVPAGFYMAIGVDNYSVSDLTPEPCRSCNETGVIKA